MGVFVVPHMVKYILAKASKKSVSSLCIPLLVVNLVTLNVGGILRFWKASLQHLKPLGTTPCEFSNKENNLPQR